MKLKDKIGDLLIEGFSLETLGRLTEKQINTLHGKVVKEQGVIRKTEKVDKITIPSGTAKTSGAEVDGMGVRTDSAGNIHITKSETAEEKKQTKKNPWAICTASLSDEFGTSERSEWTKSQMKKYERCVMGVKKNIKEGKNPYETIIESKIMDIVSKHITPKITKKDFINSLTEAGEKEITKTPEKEKGIPTKPGRKMNPFRNPSPDTKEKPRGNAEKMKTDFINLIKKVVGK